MSDLLERIRIDQVEARKAAMKDRTNAELPIKVGLLTTLLGEASKITAEEHKKGVTEVTDEKVLRTAKAIKSNIVLALRGDPEKNITPVTDEAARAKLETEVTILAAYVPEELSETELRVEIEKIAAMKGEPLTMKDMKETLASLNASHPGRVDAKILSTILRG